MTYTVEFEGDANLKVQDLTITGNTYLSNVVLDASPDLQSVTSSGNTTTQSLQITSAEASTSKLTGAIQVAGGVGVEGNVHVGSNLFVAGNVTGNVEFGTANLFVDSLTGNIGIGTTEPAESLDIVGNLNLQKVSNTASIKLNSNVVTEFVRSKKLIKYPRVALTSAASNAYENGYKVTYSNEYNSGGFAHQAYEAFDNNPSDIVGWYSGNNTSTIYNGTSGAYSGTTQLASETELGEWIGLEVPSPIKLYDVRIVAQDYSASQNTVDDFVIYAKKQSGDTWTNLGKFTGIAVRQGTATGVTVNVNSSDYYKFFALVATKRYAQTSTNGISIRVLDFFGVPEYDPDADGMEVIARSVPNVPNTDWLEVYYDGQDYTSMPVTVDDKSGNGVTGTPSGGVGFDTEYKAFTFDGVNDYIYNSTTGYTPSSMYTASLWVKMNSGGGGTSPMMFQYGNGSNNASFGLAYVSNSATSIRAFIYGNTSLNTPAKIYRRNGQWMHITATYFLTTGTIYLYIDGEFVQSASGTAAALDSTPYLSIGVQTDSSDAIISSTYLAGSIANFRLFKRTLTSDEVWQLYAYQKEYFGYSNLDMALKAGRLGLGTFEPKAQLDVQGTALFNGYVSINTSSPSESPLQIQCGGNSTTGIRIVRASGTGHWEISNQVFNDLVFSASTGGYGYLASGTNVVQIDFTGQHRSFIYGVTYTEYDNLEGLIVSANKNKYFDINEDITTGANAIQISQSLPLVSLSTKENDKACFGVISGSEDPEKREYEQGRFVTGVQKQKGDQRAFINSVGEGAMWVVNTNGPLESGDYITTSNVAGYGQRQDDDILHNYTVAKITMDCDFDPVTQPLQVIKKDEDGVNVLDEHGQLQWEDHPTETEKAYKIRYLDTAGAQTDEANAVHIAAFVGCTYHCG